MFSREMQEEIIAEIENSKQKVSKALDVDPLIEHEALHSTNMVAEILEEHLINHHYYHSKFNPKYNALIDKAGESLAEAYQSIANHSPFYKD